MKFLSDAIERVVASPLAQKKASPEILLVAGAVSMVGSTVLACRATLKMDEVLEKTKRDLDTAKALEHPDYSESDRSRDISIIYTRATVATLKLYAPAIITGVFGLACFATSNRIHVQRAAALSAAYAALDKGFREYRERVVQKYGEEEDERLRYGVEKVEIINPETGRKKMVERVPAGMPSIYARFFDEGSKSWSRDPEANFHFVWCQQNWANDVLRARGHVFLNEVYDMLGIPRTKEGAVVGWLWKPREFGHEGDNFVNFGVFNGDTQVARDFVNGKEGSILLDFNVDGVIYDKI